MLTAVSLRIPAGAHVAVVGASGSGKTSLLGVLLGTTTPTSGSVALSCPARPGWVAVDTRIWNRPLEANARYADPPADSAAMPLAHRLAVAELTETAERLRVQGNPDLGEGGRRLSGGQGQRLRIARALGRPGQRLVVLDEPFQGLERDRRRRLMGVLRRHWSSATLVCATHDIDDTTGFDLVIVMRDGTVVEFGAPESLLGKDSHYRSLVAGALDSPFDAGWHRLHLDPDPFRVAEVV